MIDVKAVAVANFLGFLMLLTITSGNSWLVKENTAESKYLKQLIAASCFSCVMDTVSFWIDGRPGELARFVNFFSNTWVYAMNMVVTPLWMFFLSIHIKGKIDKVQKNLVAVLVAIGATILMLNIFVDGLVFGIDADNVYSRGIFYHYFLAFQGFFLIDSVYLYLNARKKGGALKFFPVWVFLMPIAIGVTVQSIFYGISVIWACLAISVTGILGSLQNEVIFQDKLTGIYNRFYLDRIMKKLKHSEKTVFTAMMLDLNDFKSINDNFGHMAGDEALINAAKIIREAVGEIGSVVRYAGDEFVVILNVSDEDLAGQCADAINKGFDDFNSDERNKYKLSASIGYSIVDFKEKTVDDIMNDIDSKMYANKKEYYLTHKKASAK